MRYLYIVVAVIFMLSGGMAVAEEGQKALGAAKQDEGVKSQEKEIVTDLNDRRSDNKEYGENNEREMPQSETYDENTGLPNVVPSDKEGEI